MAESIFITASGRSAKNKSSDVAKRINDASSDINGAKKELNNVDYVNLSYELNQLETMYKKNNEQASEFEAFASTLENMVNDYIDTDKNCATRIRSNGKNHRKNTGLAKNLALASICASFDKIGKKIDEFADNVKAWVEGVVEWIKKSLKEDFKSYLQFIEGGIGLFVSVGTLVGGIAAAATGAGLPIAIPMILSSLITMYTSVDKIASSVFDISNAYETDGSTITKKAVNNKVFNFVYDVADGLAGIFTGAGLGKLADATQATELFTLLGKSDFATKAIDIIQNANKVSSAGGYVEGLQDFESIMSDFKDGKPDNILKFCLKKIFNKFYKGEIESASGAVAENMIKNNNVAGVLG